jgi:peptide-O-fucosyltransferase
MRSAILIYILNKATDYNWVLVLPPWPRLYHWKSSINQSRLPWSKFFDIESLSKFVPTTEFSQYIEEVGGTLDHVSIT